MSDEEISERLGISEKTVTNTVKKLEKEGVYTLGDNLHPLKVECIDKAIDIARLSIFLFTIFFFVVFMDLILLQF